MSLTRKTAGALGVVRLRPFDTSTLEGRSKERYRRVALTALGAFAAKGVNILTLLVTVPLTLHYLGAERYGLWMTISALVAMFGFADLGMSGALKTLLAEADGQGRQEQILALVSSAYAALSAVAFLLLLAFAVVYPFLSWAKLYNIHDPLLLPEAGPATAVVVVCFLLTFPLNLINAIQTGFQEGFQNCLWQGLGSLLALAGTLLAVWREAGLPYLALAFAGGPLLAAVFNSCSFFGLTRPWLRPRWSRSSRQALQQVISTGFWFLAWSIASATIYCSDNLVAVQILGLEAVAAYSIAVRLFNVVTLACGFFLHPFWAAYAEALGRGDGPWVRKTLFRTLWAGLAISTALSTMLLLAHQPLLHWWLGPGFRIPIILALGLTCWTVMGVVQVALFNFLIGANQMPFLVAAYTLTALASLGAKIIFTAHWGVAGLVWGNLLAHAACWLLPVVIYVPICLKRIEFNKSLGPV